MRNKIAIKAALVTLIGFGGFGILLFRSEASLGGDGSVIELCNYSKTFSEEFNSLSISSSNNLKATWSAHTPWNGDFGDARFIDPIDIYADSDKNEPFSVKNGILRIRARKHENGKWTSGLISSADPTTAGFSQTYGYFETRMKLPPGPGVWPAFWLASNVGKGSDSPTVEIDVIEYYGKFPDGIFSHVQVWDKINPSQHRSSDSIFGVKPGSLSEDFHTYGVSVDPVNITIYFDRRKIFTTTTPKEHKRPLTILLNLALGSGWPIDETPNPSDLYVDYVRVYELGASNAGVKCQD